ncbi:MAG: cell division protein SepF [Clostridia bacterium]|nr:cell division protein SepF [Clostridia bacterium]
MGFGDWLMRGLGFDSKKKSQTVVEEPVDDKYANFNMHVKQTDATSENTPIRNNFQTDALNIGMRDNLIIYAPSTMKEIQSAVDSLRQNQSVMLDLEKIGDEDRTRVLDFISGAIYGLNGSIHRFKDDSFILTPEGKKILTPDKKD